MSVIVSIARGHNGSTTLLIDGEVVFYLEEERLSRAKYDGDPLLGLQKVFDYVDYIDELLICHTHRSGPIFEWTQESVYEGFVRKLARKKFEFKTHYIDNIHHEMHAACGYYNSGFKTAACVIADGAGSFLKISDISEPCYEFESIFKVNNHTEFETVYKHIGTKESIGYTEVEPEVHITEYPGLTKMYEAVTQYCGFRAIEAGKLMGLASYGKPNDDLPNFFVDGWGSRNLIIPTYPNAAQINLSRYEIIRKDYEQHDPNNSGKYTDIQKDLAYKVQEETSDRMVELIRKAHELTGETNIIICGGYGLNCVANYKYIKEFPDLNIYCEPISHDGGTSIGAAKYHYAHSTGRTPESQSTVYYGPQYDPDTYLRDLNDVDVVDTSYKDIAKLIRDGNIVTIFQGKSEAGPRALGNRSILFDPTIKDGKDIVNNVKHREWFRPFACSVLKEKVHNWFDLAGMDESPSMMYAVEAKEEVVNIIPSVIHVDNTCRIQTVTKEQNEHYYNLIAEFEKLSDVPILFNTSFNLGGDPLVETIEDAIDTLRKSEIEYMYLPEIQKLAKVLN
jgi:carbamoyltransferase